MAKPRTFWGITYLAGPKDHWTLKSAYFEDPTPVIQVQTLPLEGPRSLGVKSSSNFYFRVHGLSEYQTLPQLVVFPTESCRDPSWIVIEGGHLPVIK